MIFPGQLLSYPAKTFRSDAQIRGYENLGYAKQEVGIHPDEIEVPFFCCGTLQLGNPSLQMPDMVMQQLIIELQEGRIGFRQLKEQAFVQKKGDRIFQGLHKIRRRLVKINTFPVRHEPVLRRKLDNMLFPFFINRKLAQQSALYKKRISAFFSLH